MKLRPQDLDQLYDLADEIEDHPEQWQTPHQLSAAIKLQAHRLRALILAADE